MLPTRTDSVPFFNDYLNYRRDPLQFWLDSGEVASISRVKLGPSREFILVTDADLAQHILQKKARIYIRERQLMTLNRMGGPELMFNTDNWDEWLWRRRLMQPGFHRKQIEGFATAMVTETNALIAELPRGAQFDLQHAMKTLTMRIIARTMFSVTDRFETDQLQDAFEVGSEVVFKRASAIWAPPLWTRTPLIQRGLAARQVRDKFLSRIVKDRYASQQPQGDLLDTLIEARLEEGQQFTADQLIGEMGGIVFAGHDTTALTLSWLFYLLEQHPAALEKVLSEIEAVLGDRNATLADLEHMPFTEMVVKEALRLYPPVYLTIREADEDDQFGALKINKGDSLVLNIRGLQQSKLYWDNPKAFDPERFSPERSQDRHKFAWVPFIDGPRKCMGDTFAMMEMRLIVPTVLQQLSLRYVGTVPKQPEPGFVMGAQDGMEMLAEDRG